MFPSLRNSLALHNMWTDARYSRGKQRNLLGPELEALRL
jgi:hypothetical protein